jgi:hypothetical protein
LVDALFVIATTLASTALLAACRNWTQARSFQAVFNKNDPRRRALNHKRQAPKEDVMFKTLPVAVFVTVMSLSPAYAAGECTEAHMKQMDGMIAKMTDAAKKKEATMHLDMSKAEMKKGNEAGCMKHMNEAHKAMGL